MVSGKKIIALIPARGGSKRLPRKNMLPLGGKPLIAWTIEAALGVNGVDTVCVSTDDIEIQKTAEKYGAECPFIRPQILSGDNASSKDVVAHAIEFYREKKGIAFDILILLQPTSPLRTTDDIEGALRLFYDKKADNVVSVSETEHSPLWCNVLPSDLSLKGFIKDDLKKIRSQDLPKFYRINGSIYIIGVISFQNKQSLILEDDSYAFIMPKERSIDIDTQMDFRIAEAIL